MTIFNEKNLASLEDAQKAHEYAQVLGMVKVKALYQADRLNPQTWKKLNPLISDRRWIHAMKIGLLSEDEFYDGGRDMDTEVEPNHVIPSEEKDIAGETELEHSITPTLESAEILKSTEVLESESQDELAAIEEQTEVVAPVIEPEIEQVEAIEDEYVIAINQDSATTVKEENEDAQQEDTAEEKLVPVVSDDDHAIDDESSDETEANEERSSFVSWLTTLPKVAGYKKLEAEDDNQTVTSIQSTYLTEQESTMKTDSLEASEKKAKEKKEKKKQEKKKKEEKRKKEKKKKEKKKRKEKERKEKEKRKKRKEKEKKKKRKLKKKKQKAKNKKKDEEPPFQDRVVGSLLLDDSIASETLAELLHNHGHMRLARKMYERLKMKNPEKSSYFAALIEELNEED